MTGGAGVDHKLMAMGEVRAPKTRVTWRPMRQSGLGPGGAHDVGPCVVIHVDQMPDEARRRSVLRRLTDSLRQPLNTPTPPWEEHMGVVDHRTAERIASDHGAQLEIRGN